MASGLAGTKSFALRNRCGPTEINSLLTIGEPVSDPNIPYDQYEKSFSSQNVFVMAAARLGCFSGVAEEFEAACHPLLVGRIHIIGP